MLRDFAELWPKKFYNVTNGVIPRRFVALANPGLTELITRKIGESWLKGLAFAPQIPVGSPPVTTTSKSSVIDSRHRGE